MTDRLQYGDAAWTFTFSPDQIGRELSHFTPIWCITVSQLSEISGFTERDVTLVQRETLQEKEDKRLEQMEMSAL